MTKLDLEQEKYPGLRKGLVTIVGGLSLLFLTGVLLGFSVATFEHGGPNVTDAAIIAAILAMIAAVVFAGWKLWPRDIDEPLSPSTRKARNWMNVIIAFSVAAGFGFAIMEGPESASLFSNGPLDPLIAMLALIGWLVVTPAISWAWWRNVDEHEAASYRDSGIVAVHFYFFLAPAWWFASRAGWVPAQDPMIVFAIVTTVWMLAWAYRKYT